MSDTQRPKRETMSIEEATISNMWEIAAIVELLGTEGPLHQAGLAHHHRRATQEKPSRQNP
jgi:hypothetical protein